MKAKLLSGIFLATSLLSGCDNTSQQNTAATETDSVSTTNTSQAASEVSLTKKWETEAVLNVPESVFYDQKNNVLYVSNINGQSDGKDGNGFISKVSLEGKVDNLEWVKGLDAPKGMGVYNDKLYVADLANVKVINLADGKMLKTINAKDASFLNDVTVDSNGVVYVSDSNTKRIYKIQNDTAELWMENSDLKKPNGLLAVGNEVILLDMDQAGTFYKVNASDKKMNKFAENVSFGDGVVMVDDNEYLISNWNGEITYVNGNGEKQLLLDTKEQKINAADIEYVPSQNLLLVPTFFGNKVMAYEFKK
jgi:sugar lactone lactonase YvrE